MSPRVARSVGLACVAVALATLHFAPAFVVPDATGFGDWQMIHHNWEAAFVALARYGEWPLFDPFHCGGVSIVGNPEAQAYSPLFLLSFLVGTTAATKLFVVLHVAAAFAGAFVYAEERLLASPSAATLAGVVFAGSGFFAWHLAGGHATFAPFAFLPWLELALVRGEHDARAWIGAGALHGLTLAEGGTYPFPYMALALAVSAALRCLAHPEATLRVLRSLLVPIALGAALAAHRVLPIAESLARVPRTIGSSDASSLADVWLMLTARDHGWHFEGHEFVWPEYGTYVGVGALALAALAPLRMRDRGLRGATPHHLLAGALAVALVLGHAGVLAPWPLLRLLPVFDSLRVPSRFMVVVTFHLACLAALGLDGLRLPRFPRVDRALALASWLAVVGLTADVAVVTRPIVNRWHGHAIDGTAFAPERTYALGADYGRTFASNPRRNESTTLCYVGGMNWQVSGALRLGRAPQVEVARGEGSARLVRQTTSTFVAEAELATPGRVVFNVNFDPAFEATRGRVVDDAGRLALDLPRGMHRVVVRYTPVSFFVGVGVGTLTALAAFAFLLRRRFA